MYMYYYKKYGNIRFVDFFFLIFNNHISDILSVPINTILKSTEKYIMIHNRNFISKEGTNC